MWTPTHADLQIAKCQIRTVHKEEQTQEIKFLENYWRGRTNVYTLIIRKYSKHKVTNNKGVKLIPFSSGVNELIAHTMSKRIFTEVLGSHQTAYQLFR